LFVYYAVTLCKCCSAATLALCGGGTFVNDPGRNRGGSGPSAFLLLPNITSPPQNVCSLVLIPDYQVLCCRMQHLAAAARHFSEALNFQKGNIYAANGLGAVLASLGRLEAARSIFSQLRESAALTSGFVEVPDVRFQSSGSFSTLLNFETMPKCIYVFCIL